MTDGGYHIALISSSLGEYELIEGEVAIRYRRGMHSKSQCVRLVSEVLTSINSNGSEQKEQNEASGDRNTVDLLM